MSVYASFDFDDEPAAAVTRTGDDQWTLSLTAEDGAGLRTVHLRFDLDSLHHTLTQWLSEVERIRAAKPRLWPVPS